MSISISVCPAEWRVYIVEAGTCSVFVVAVPLCVQVRQILKNGVECSIFYYGSTACIVSVMLIRWLFLTFLRSCTGNIPLKRRKYEFICIAMSHLLFCISDLRLPFLD